MVEYAYTGSWSPNTSWATGMTPVVYKASQPIQSTTPITGTNASPVGKPIPTGLGMVVVPGDPVIDPKHLGGYRQDGDKVLVNLVFCLLDTQLGGTFELIWARANEQFIIRNQAPVRSITSPYRFYGGNQTAVDPIKTAFLAARYRTAWPGFVYIVFENFDIAPYDNKVPIFDFQIASSVTGAPFSEEQSSLTFGPTSSDSAPFCVDAFRRLHYQLSDGSSLANDTTLHTISISSLVETARVAITAPDGYRQIFFPVSLNDTDYIVAGKSGTTLSIEPIELCLIKISTGEIVNKIDVVTNGFGDLFEPLIISAISLDDAGKFLVFCREYATPAAQSDLYVALVDTSDESLSWLVHPLDDPVGSAGTTVFSVAAVVKSGVASVFVTAFNDTVTPVISENVWRYKFNASGLLSDDIIYTEADSGKMPIGVAYDLTDNGLCVYRQDGSVKKISSGGGTIYETAAQTPTNLNLNTGNTGDSSGFSYRARPGYAAAFQGQFGDLYLVSLSDGSLTKLIETDDFTNGTFGHYFDQYTSTMTMDWDAAGGILNRIILGDRTPDAIDLADILLALTTFDGRHDVSETAFTNFPGGECYGVKYETDTSIQDALRALREPFDISIVESDGKLKFRYPRRDGSYALDATITAVSIVDKGQFTIEKMAGTEEEALVECEISFYDYNNYGERNTASFSRPTGAYDLTKSINKRSLNLPLYMTASRALEQAALVVYRSVYALESYRVSFGSELAYLEPGDTVQFPFASDTTSFDVVVQLKDGTLNANYTQDFVGYQYLQAHDATYTGAEIVTPPEAPNFQYLTFLTVPGSFVMTGNSINLNVNVTLTAGTGSFTLTGNSVSLDAAFLTAGTGTFTLTGNSVTLTYSGGGSGFDSGFSSGFGA